MRRKWGKGKERGREKGRVCFSLMVQSVMMGGRLGAEKHEAIGQSHFVHRKQRGESDAHLGCYSFLLL